MDDVTVVKPFGKPLEDRAADWSRVEHLPKERGAAPIEAIVSVVEGPDPVSRGREDVPSKDSKPKSQNDVDLAIANHLEVGAAETIRGAVRDGFYNDRCALPHPTGDVDRVERVGFGAVPAVVPGDVLGEEPRSPSS